jgi:hypothetical protein
MDEGPVGAELSIYGVTTRHVITPMDYPTPRLIAQLANAWKEVGRESPGVTNELGQAIRSFGRQLEDQHFDVLSLETFDLGALRVRHVTTWEMALRERQEIDRTDTPYRYVVYLFALLRRIDDDQPGILDAALAARVRQGTRLSHIRRPGEPDHSDNETRRIRSAAHRLVHHAKQQHRLDASYLPSPAVMVALHVLLSLATGEPPEVLRAIKIHDIIVTPTDGHRQPKVVDPHAATQQWVALNEVQVFAVTLTKKRAGRRYEEVYDRSLNRAAHHTLTTLLDLTAHARTLTAETSVWLIGSQDSVRQMPWNSTAANLGRWYEKYVLGPPITGPFKYLRLRKVVLRREIIANPARYLRDGRHHTRQTWLNHYANSAVLRAHAGRLVVDAISDYFNAAVGPTVITPDAEELVRQGQTVEVLDPGTAQMLLHGDLGGALTPVRMRSSPRNTYLHSFSSTKFPTPMLPRIWLCGTRCGNRSTAPPGGSCLCFRASR